MLFSLFFSVAVLSASVLLIALYLDVFFLGLSHFFRPFGLVTPLSGIPLCQSLILPVYVNIDYHVLCNEYLVIYTAVILLCHSLINDVAWLYLSKKVSAAF